MKVFKKLSIISLIMMLFLSITMFATLTSFAQEPVKLVLATHMAVDNVFYLTLEYFAEKVKEYYDGPITFELHHSADLGSNIEEFEYMLQGD